MSRPTLQLSPSLESSSSVSDALRPSLFDAKDDFIERVAPLGMAAIFFGGFTLAPQDAALSRQALFKLSFAHRHFLQPIGLRILVQRKTAIFSGKVTSRPLVVMADILARQIEGILDVYDETEKPTTSAAELARESLQLLFATDQTLRSGVQVNLHQGHLKLEGTVPSAAQKSWAEALALAATSGIESLLQVSEVAPSVAPNMTPSIGMDDESLQALVLFRLRLIRETEHLPLKVRSNRGILTLQGKVRTEALRQRVENIARSTLGLVELRSSLSIAP